MGFIIISHCHEMFDIIKPNKVIVMFDGKIVADGNEKLIKKINKEGFNFVNDLNINDNTNRCPICSINKVNDKKKKKNV